MRTKQASINHINGYDITKIIQETSLYHGIELRGSDSVFQSDDDSTFLGIIITLSLSLSLSLSLLYC